MLVPFKELESGNTVFVNPERVVAIFIAVDEKHKGKTVINLTNGNLLTDVDQLEAVGLINGALNG